MTSANALNCLRLVPLAFLPAMLTGCLALPFGGGGDKAEAPKPAGEMVIGASLPDLREPDAAVLAELTEAKRLFDEKKLIEAEKIFARLARNKKNPSKVMEESRFLEAECQVLRNELSKAEGTYKLLIKEYNNHSQYTNKAAQRLYDIADYWLNDTRKQMELYEQKRAGKVWFVTPSFVHWTKDKPFLDEEGRALQCLEAVVFADIGSGPLKEKALFYLGTVHFFRENYREADSWYSQLYKDPTYKKRELAAKAFKQSIICKQVVNGGSAYDRRTLEQARQMVAEARIIFPEMAQKEKDWLDRQVVNINHQQADGDFNTAEFYKRIGKPGSAYFYYELVRRRYPGTNYAEQSVARMGEIRDQAEKEKRSLDKADDDLRYANHQDGFFARLFQRRTPDAAPPQQQQTIVPVSMPGDPVRN